MSQSPTSNEIFSGSFASNLHSPISSHPIDPPPSNPKQRPRRLVPCPKKDKIKRQFYESYLYKNLFRSAAKSSWSQLVRHDPFERRHRRLHREQQVGNPYTPKSVVASLSTLDVLRGAGRRSATVPCLLTPVPHGAAGNTIATSQPQKKSSLVPLDTMASHRGCNKKDVEKKILRKKSTSVSKSRQAVLSPSVKLERKQLRQIVRCLRQGITVSQVGHRFVPNPTLLKGSAGNPASSFRAPMIAFERPSGHESLSVSPATSTVFSTRSSPLSSHRRRDLFQPNANHPFEDSTRPPLHFPALEVYMQGDTAPFLVLHNVHPLDSLATLRDRIELEMLALPGGDSLAHESGWTFQAFQPSILRHLEALLHDFETFYSDTDYLRYGSDKQKDIRLTTMRHREQAACLAKHLRLLRYTLEHDASVHQLCPRVRMNVSHVEKHGLPPPSFVSNHGGSLQLPPPAFSVNLAARRRLLRPVQGAIQSQLSRLSAALTGPAVPPPVNCNLPPFVCEAKRLMDRLRTIQRRRVAKSHWDEIGAYPAHHPQMAHARTANGAEVSLMIPKVVLIARNATPKWKMVESSQLVVWRLCDIGCSSLLLPVSTSQHAEGEEDDDGELNRSSGRTVIPADGKTDPFLGVLEPLPDMDKHKQQCGVAAAGARLSISDGMKSKRHSTAATAEAASATGSSAAGPRPTSAALSDPRRSLSPASAVQQTPQAELTELLTGNHVPLNRVTEIGMSLLDVCALRWDHSLIAVLCKSRVNVLHQDPLMGNTALHRLLLQRRHYRRAVDSVSTTTTAAAAPQQLRQCIVAILLSTPSSMLAALLQQTNKRGATPLWIAVENQDLDMVRALIEAGSQRCRTQLAAYPSATEMEFLRTQYHPEYFIDHGDLEGLKWCVELLGISVKEVFGEGLRCPLLHRVFLSRGFSSEELQSETIAWLLHKGASPLQRDQYQRNAFHYAAQCGACRWLIPLADHTHRSVGSMSMGSSSTETSNQRHTAELFKRLVGATSSNFNSTGKTIAQTVDLSGNSVCHAVLLYAGVAPKRYAAEDDTPSSTGFQTGLEVLETEGAAFLGHPAIAPFILVDQKNSCGGHTILHLAMARKSPVILQLLSKNLKYESMATLQTLMSITNDDGDTILGSAIRADFALGLRTILELETAAEAALRAPCSNARQPLLLAVECAVAKASTGELIDVMRQRPHCHAREQEDCVNVILSMASTHGCLSTIVHGRSGPLQETALHAAVRGRLWHTCALLLTHGASVVAPNAAGVTPLMLACQIPDDASIARLLVANDQRNIGEGDTLRLLFTAGGAAAFNVPLITDRFLQRSTFPWADPSFSDPMLRAAATSGNLDALDALIRLGAVPSPPTPELPSPLEVLLKLAWRAVESNTRGVDHARRIRCVKGPSSPQLLNRSAEETILLALHTTAWPLPSCALYYSIRLGYTQLARSCISLSDKEPIQRMLSFSHFSNCAVNALLQPSSNATWGSVIRATLLVHTPNALADGSTLWYRKALAQAMTVGDVESFSLLVGRSIDRSACAALRAMHGHNNHRGSCGGSGGAPRSSTTMQWLVSRCHFSFEWILLCAVHEGQSDCWTNLMSVLYRGVVPLRELLAPPRSLSGSSFRAARNATCAADVKRITDVFSNASLFSVLFAVSNLQHDDTAGLLLELLGLCEPHVAQGDLQWLLAVREALDLSLLSGQSVAYRILLNWIHSNASVYKDLILLGRFPENLRARLAHTTALECFLAASSKCLLFLPASATPLASSVRSLVDQLECVVDASEMLEGELCLSHLFGSFETCQHQYHCFRHPPQRHHHPFSGRNSITNSMESGQRTIPLHLHRFPRCHEVDPARWKQLTIELWDAIAIVAVSADRCHNAAVVRRRFSSMDTALQETMKPRVLEPAVTRAKNMLNDVAPAVSPFHISQFLWLGWSGMGQYVLDNVMRLPPFHFAQVHGVLSHAFDSFGESLLGVVASSSLLPDATVIRTLETCRTEANDWRDHSVGWIERLLDISHPAQHQRISTSMRLQFPILSMMRDQGLKEPSTVRILSGGGSSLAASVSPSRQTLDPQDSGSMASSRFAVSVVPAPLHRVVRAKRLNVLRAMLELGGSPSNVNVDVTDSDNRTPLMIAAMNGGTDEALLLLEAGANVLMSDRHGLTALHYAASRGHKHIVESITRTEDGPEALQILGPNRVTPLMLAVQHGKRHCAESLIAAIADDAKNMSLTNTHAATGESLLHFAVWWNLHSLIVEELIPSFNVSQLVATSRAGYTARDYCKPGSPIDKLLASKGVPRLVRLHSRGVFSMRPRDMRIMSHMMPLYCDRSALALPASPAAVETSSPTTSTRSPTNQIEWCLLSPNEPRTWKHALRMKDAEDDTPPISVDEQAWGLARTGQDRRLKNLLATGVKDMFQIRVYGLPLPRSEGDKQALVKEVNSILARFGGCRGGCQLVFPDNVAVSGESRSPSAATPHGTAHSSPSGAGVPDPSSTISASSFGAIPSRGTSPISPLATVTAPTGWYARAEMNDADRTVALLATDNVSLKGRSLKFVRDTPIGPTYRTNLVPNRTSLLHLICQNSLVESLQYVLQNNQSEGSANLLICDLLGGSYDEAGLSPFHIAVLRRNWKVVVMLIHNRVSLLPARDLPLTPFDFFACDADIALLRWLVMVGAGSAGSSLGGNPRCFWQAITTADSTGKRKTAPQQSNSTCTERLTEREATAIAYCLAKEYPNPLLQSRIQRVILSSILNPEPLVASLLQTTERWFHQSVRAPFEQFLHNNLADGGAPELSARVRDVADRLQKHFFGRLFKELSADDSSASDGTLTSRSLDIQVDVEGADGRDNAMDRERTKALLSFHLAGGALGGILENLLRPLFARLESHQWQPSADAAGLPYVVGCMMSGWFVLSRLQRIVIQCNRKDSEEPLVEMEVLDSVGNLALIFSVAVQANTVVVCGDPMALLEKHFFLSGQRLLEAMEWNLAAVSSPSKLEISIADQTSLTLRRMIEALQDAHLFQSALPQGTDIVAADSWLRILNGHLLAQAAKVESDPQRIEAAASEEANKLTCLLEKSAEAVDRITKWFLWNPTTDYPRAADVRKKDPQATVSHHCEVQLSVFETYRVPSTSSLHLLIYNSSAVQRGEDASPPPSERYGPSMSHTSTEDLDELDASSRDAELTVATRVDNERVKASVVETYEGLALLQRSEVKRRVQPLGLKYLYDARRTLEGEPFVFLTFDVAHIASQRRTDGISVGRGSTWDGPALRELQWKRLDPPNAANVSRRTRSKASTIHRPLRPDSVLSLNDLSVRPCSPALIRSDPLTGIDSIASLSLRLRQSSDHLESLLQKLHDLEPTKQRGEEEDEEGVTSTPLSVRESVFQRVALHRKESVQRTVVQLPQQWDREASQKWTELIPLVYPFLLDVTFALGSLQRVCRSWHHTVRLMVQSSVLVRPLRDIATRLDDLVVSLQPALRIACPRGHEEVVLSLLACSHPICLPRTPERAVWTDVVWQAFCEHPLRFLQHCASLNTEGIYGAVFRRDLPRLYGKESQLNGGGTNHQERGGPLTAAVNLTPSVQSVLEIIARVFTLLYGALGALQRTSDAIRRLSAKVNET